MLGIGVLEGWPLQGENGILGRQGIADYNRQSVQRVPGDATGKELAMLILNGASQLTLNRLTVQIGQHRQTVDFLQRLDVLFLLKRNLKEADGALPITAAESETTEDITE